MRSPVQVRQTGMCGGARLSELMRSSRTVVDRLTFLTRDAHDHNIRTTTAS